MAIYQWLAAAGIIGVVVVLTYLVRSPTVLTWGDNEGMITCPHCRGLGLVEFDLDPYAPVRAVPDEQFNDIRIGTQICRLCSGGRRISQEYYDQWRQSRN
jgi:hypothetical protein